MKTPSAPSRTPVLTQDQMVVNFPIVGIGASAGGLAAFEAFFSGMPADIEPGMAFVLVQHLAPSPPISRPSEHQRHDKQAHHHEGDDDLGDHARHDAQPGGHAHVHGAAFVAAWAIRRRRKPAR